MSALMAKDLHTAVNTIASGIDNKTFSEESFNNKRKWYKWKISNENLLLILIIAGKCSVALIAKRKKIIYPVNLFHNSNKHFFYKSYFNVNKENPCLFFN